MSDRFKFRFWNKLRKTYENTYDLKCCEHLDYVVPEQCTGLKDKNGNLIYEGDILSLYKLKNPIVVICKWNIDKWVFVDTSGCIRNDYSMEIIGNIHENQELLEKINE